VGKNGINPEAARQEKSALLALLSGKRILEVGAGSGRTTFIYADVAKSVDAIDVEAKALALLERQAKENGLSGKITAKAQSLFDVGSGKRYDAALFTFSLHEMPAVKSLKKAFEIADSVIVFDHYLNSEWSEMCGEKCKVEREWKAISKYAVSKESPIDGVYRFDDFGTLQNYVAECAAARRNSAKYKDKAPIFIKSPRRIVELKKKIK